MGLVAILLLSPLLQEVHEEVPLGLLSVAAVLLFAWVMGTLIGLGLWWGKCRSGLVAIVMAVSLASLAEMEGIRRASSRDATVQPTFDQRREGVRERTVRQMPHGRWKTGVYLRGETVPLLRILEAILMAIVASFVAFRWTRWPFCERCDAWADPPTLTGSDLFCSKCE